MLRKAFAVLTAFVLVFSAFNISYAEKQTEKQYIARLKLSSMQSVWDIPLSHQMN